MSVEEQVGERARLPGNGAARTVAAPETERSARSPLVGQAGAGPAAMAAPGGAAAARPRRSRRRIVIPLLLVALVVAVIFGYRYWRDATLYVSTDDAQVAGNMVQVGTVNTGLVSGVAVDVGNTVRQGQPVATVTLPSTLSVTDSGTPRLGFRGTQDAQVPVTSPIDGVVVQRLANPGDTAAAGQTIITVVDPTQLWVQAEIQETAIDRVRVGQAVDVHVDSLGTDLPGRVLAVDRASAASFSLLPQGNTSGNFTKVTQLVPVKIAVDYGSQPLVLGSSVEVKIHVQ